MNRLLLFLLVSLFISLQSATSSGLAYGDFPVVLPYKIQIADGRIINAGKYIATINIKPQFFSSNLNCTFEILNDAGVAKATSNHVEWSLAKPIKGIPAICMKIPDNIEDQRRLYKTIMIDKSRHMFYYEIVLHKNLSNETLIVISPYQVLFQE